MMMSLMRTSRHLLVGLIMLLIAMLNVALAMGDKKFLKGLILGLMLMQNKKDNIHVSPMYVPS